MEGMRFALQGNVADTPELTAEALAEQAWNSRVGAGYFVLMEGVLMVANAGQKVDVVLARWRADRDVALARGFAPTQAIPADLVGGMQISQLEEYFPRASNGQAVCGGHPAPVYGEWTNIAVWYNPGCDPALTGIRLLEDQEAKSPWFHKPKA
ncbi:hypothetical protein EBS80_01500 [bacterium]|nr:hypothetical protein [bacterium]